MNVRMICAGLGVAALLLSGCGSDDGDKAKDPTGSGGGASASMPTDASLDDFCAATRKAGQIDPSGDVEAQIEDSKKGIAEMRELGTPEDMPEDVRATYVDFLDVMAELTPDDVTALTESGFEGIGLKEDEMMAYGTYLLENCGAPSAPPSDS